MADDFEETRKALERQLIAAATELRDYMNCSTLRVPIDERLVVYVGPGDRVR